MSLKNRIKDDRPLTETERDDFYKDYSHYARKPRKQPRDEKGQFMKVE